MVTLAGAGSMVQVFGTTISYENISNGQATLRTGDQAVSCVPGQSVSAGPLTLRCTKVTDDTVEFTATVT